MAIPGFGPLSSAPLSSTGQQFVEEIISIDLASLTLTQQESQINQTINIDLATLSLTAQDANINETVDVDTSSLTLTQQNVTIVDVVPVDLATLTLTAQDADIDVSVIPDLATLTLTSNDHNINITVPVDTTALILTSNEHNINQTVDVDTATLTLTQQDSTVEENINVDLATLTLTSFEIAEFIRIDTSTLTLTSFDHGAGTGVLLDSKALTLTSFDITDFVVMETGALTLTQQASDVIQSYNYTSVVTPITFSGAATTTSQEIISIDAGALVLTAQFIEIDRTVNVDTATLTLTQQDSDVVTSFVYTTVSTPITFSGVADLSIEKDYNTVPTPITFSGIATTQLNQNVAVDAATLTLTSNDHDILEALPVDLATLTLTQLESTVLAAENIPIDLAALTLSAFAAEEFNTYTYTTVTTPITFSGAATTQFNVVIPVTTTALTLTSNVHDILEGEEPVLVDLATLNISPIDPRVVDVVPVNAGSLTLTALETIEPIEVDTGALTLTSYSVFVEAITTITFLQISNAGSGYTVGDVLTVVGGIIVGTAATILVTEVNENGSIVAAEIQDGGTYLAGDEDEGGGVPQSPVEITGGTGTGATFNIVAADGSGEVIIPGQQDQRVSLLGTGRWVHRLGDPNTGGGIITEIPQGTVFANNRLVAVDGSKGISHTPFTTPHLYPVWVTSQGGGVNGGPGSGGAVPNVFAEGIPVNDVDDPDSCLHVRDTGSFDVFTHTFDSVVVDGISIPAEPYDYSHAEPVVTEAGSNAPQDEYVYKDEPNNYPPDTPPATTDPVDDQEEPEEPSEDEVVINCAEMEVVDYDFQLSTNYQLRDVSTQALFPHGIKAQCGLSIADIACNLQAVAENILEKVNATYPGFRINSGFRSATSCRSQHEKGQAVDLQWAGYTGAQYMEIAQWVKNNLIYDQLIMEHGNSVWLHISFSRTINRRAVLTYYQGNYTPGLTQYYA